MGYAKGKNDITGIVWLAIYGNLYEISDKEKEDEKETRRKEEGQVSLFLWCSFSVPFGVL